MNIYKVKNFQIFKNILMVSLLIIILTSCRSTYKYSYELDTLNNEVISAEIVEVTTLENGEIEVKKINFISNNNLSSVLSDLSDLEIVVTEGRPQIPSGICLKLNYEKEYDLLCKNSLMKYKNNGEPIDHKDIYKPKGFDEFISKHKSEE